jgi:hypothetical protein
MYLRAHATAHQYKYLNLKDSLAERGGIRTHHDPLDSVSCRFYSAAIAVNASNAAAPCTRLHPRPSLARDLS